MHKALSAIISLIAISCLPLYSKAQFDIVIAGQKYHIKKFKENQVYPNSSVFEMDSVLSPITQSKYELEIRYSLSSNWMGYDENCIVIRGNHDSLEAVYYYWHYFSEADLKSKLADSIRILHRYDRLGVKNRYGVYIKPLKPAQSLNKLLDTLLSHHICESPNDYDVVDDLNKKGISPKVIQCMDCTNFAIYEIKIANYYRRFFVSNRYQNYNPDIPEFADQRILDNVFQSLLPNIKK